MRKSDEAEVVLHYAREALILEALATAEDPKGPAKHMGDLQRAARAYRLATQEHGVAG